MRDLKIAQKQMVEIAKAICFNVELLIMDEPTSMLTGKETKVLFDLIANLGSQGIAVVYISHRLKEIIDICARVTVLKDGALVGVKNVAEVTAQDIAALMVGRLVQDDKGEGLPGRPRGGDAGGARRHRQPAEGRELHRCAGARSSASAAWWARAGPS